MISEGPREGRRAFDSSTQQLVPAPKLEAAARFPQGHEQINYHLQGFTRAKKLLTTYSCWQARLRQGGERV